MLRTDLFLATLFLQGLWGLVIAIILVTALLSVWFSDKPKRSNEGRRRESLQQTKPQQQRRSIVIAQKQHSRLRKGVYARKSLDAILQKGMVCTIVARTLFV